MRRGPIASATTSLSSKKGTGENPEVPEPLEITKLDPKGPKEVHVAQSEVNAEKDQMQSTADESPAPMSPQPLKIPESVPKKVGEMEIEKATENRGPSDVCKEQQSEPMEISK